MSVNRGKDFENVIKESVEKCAAIIRLHDQTNGFKGSANICDFIAYRYPNMFFFECKSVRGNTFPFSNITDTQWNGMVKYADISMGIKAGVICWWTERDVTRFIPIETLCFYRNLLGKKSISYLEDPVDNEHPIYNIPGKKKRVFFEYDFESFFDEIQR